MERIKITWSGYDKTWDSEEVLPDAKWAVTDICLSRQHKDHVNYWTVLPDTFTNRKWMIAHSNLNVSATRFCGVILVQLSPCAPIPVLEVVDAEELVSEANFRNMTAVVVNKDYQVEAVMRLVDMVHPRHATVKMIRFRGIGGHPILVADKESGYDVYSRLNSELHQKVIIKCGDKAHYIWDQAWNQFENEMVGTHHHIGLKWGVADFPDRIDATVGTKDFYDLLVKVTKFMKQFD